MQMYCTTDQKNTLCDAQKMVTRLNSDDGAQANSYFFFSSSLLLLKPFCLYSRANQWQTSVYCLFFAQATALLLHPPILEMFLPISAFTYHFLGDIELPMPRPLRHISELTQLLFIPTNNLVMKY